MKIRSAASRAACGVLLAACCANAIDLNVDSSDSVKSTAKTIARGMMNYYNGNTYGNTPGLLPAPYYWWEAGAMFGSLIDYWYYTRDTTYNDIVSEAILFQTGGNADFMPQNQTLTEGNDDQAFWGIAAMSAAEVRFPNPPPDRPQWLALAQAVFNLQAARWDNTSCAGGLKWQIYPFNNGYNYKNSISQGGFFNIAARLGAYTQNSTYLEWAERTWDWVVLVGLIDENYKVYDGSDDTLNCTELDRVQWTYNAGVFLYGAAVMWNQTSGDRQTEWRTRVDGILTRSFVDFFEGTNDQVMFEVACEGNGNCDTDQLSFKAYLSRWMAATTKVAPWTTKRIMPYLRQSAQAAAQSCVGGSDGVTCGTRWTVSGWDGSFGVGQQMSALEVIQSNLISAVSGPLSNQTGGISIGDPSAGTKSHDLPWEPMRPITAGDKAGAGVLTAMILIATMSGGWWIST